LGRLIRPSTGQAIDAIKDRLKAQKDLVLDRLKAQKDLVLDELYDDVHRVFVPDIC
jgi:hypothetical protein